MLLLTWSNPSLTSGLPLVILFPHYPRLRELLYLCLKCSELLLRIHDILDKTVSKRVGNLAQILAYQFNSVSRQHCEVWVLQFPFLHSLQEVIPPSEACLYGPINWSMAQAHSVGLSQSFPPKRVGMARPWAGFHFTVQKRPMSGSVPGTSGASLLKRPHLESGNEAHLSDKKSAGGSVSTSSAETRRKGGVGVSIPDVPESSDSSTSSSSTSAAFEVGMLFKFLISGEALHPTSLCLIWFGVTIFSLGPILPCSVTSSNLMSRWQQLIILLFRGRLMIFLLREQLNPLLVVLVSVLVCLWCLSILVASDPYLT